MNFVKDDVVLSRCTKWYIRVSLTCVGFHSLRRRASDTVLFAKRAVLEWDEDGEYDLNVVIINNYLLILYGSLCAHSYLLPEA